jgi:hypothetical protein
MLNSCDPRQVAAETSPARLQDEIKMLVTRIVDSFTEKLRLYVLDRLRNKFNTQKEAG